MDLWDGGERRTTDDDEAALHEKAQRVAVYVRAQKFVEHETQKLVIRTRWKSGSISFFAALVVALGVSLLLNNDLRAGARENARRNCQIQAAGRPVGNGRALVMRQILRIADDAFQQFPPRFQERENAYINATLLTAHRRRLLAPDAPTKVNGFGDLKVLLEYLPPLNCSKTIR